jgi:hypothetical protein
MPGKTEMLKTEMLKRRKAIEPFYAKATKVKAVEEMGILNDGFWLLNGRVRRTKSSMPLLLQIP